MANPIHDQIGAAASDAARRLRNASDNDDQYSLAGHGHVAKAVIRRWFEEGGESSQQRMCDHVASAPQVVFSAAAFPGVATCGDCFEQMFSSYVKVCALTGEGRPCDGCRQMAPEGKTGVLSCGPMLMTISLCRMCAALEEATETEA
jgi:hypothetical protein